MSPSDQSQFDPSDPDDLLVATGEGNLSGDSHFGVGVYVIKHATLSSPQLEGPFGGIPDVSVNGVVVDRARPTDLYAGTDRGVYASTDGGASGRHYGVFLPNVEVYDLQIHGELHILRAATHGLGMWEVPAQSLFGPEQPH
jgi:hypothetical protein